MLIILKYPGKNQKTSAQHCSMNRIIIIPGKHVLVIAAATDIQTILRLSLETVTDLTVTTTHSLETGITLIHQLNPDVILFDAIGLDNDQLCQLRSVTQVPVICLVPRVRLSDQRLGQAQGVTEVLSKPFDPEVLAKTVLSTISQQKSRCHYTRSAA
jgi:DNA-binding response OmpR family regulator